MLSKKNIIISVLLLLLTCTTVSAAITNDIHDNIYLKDFDYSIHNNSVGKYDNICEEYDYEIDYELGNVSKSVIGSKIVTELYDENNTAVTSDSTIHKDFNSTQRVTDDYIIDNTMYVSVFYSLHNFTNVTHCVIKIIDDNGDVVFNTTHEFNMTEFEDLKAEDNNFDSIFNTDILFIASPNSFTTLS